MPNQVHTKMEATAIYATLQEDQISYKIWNLTFSYIDYSSWYKKNRNLKAIIYQMIITVFSILLSLSLYQTQETTSQCNQHQKRQIMQVNITIQDCEINYVSK